MESRENFFQNAAWWSILLEDKLSDKKTKDGAFLCWVNPKSSPDSNKLHLDDSRVHVSDGLAKCFKSRS